MKIKNMLMLGGVLAGAAYLRDKSRRDRLMTQGRDLLDKAKSRATELAHQVETRTREVAGSADSSVSPSTYGAGATTRSDNGIGTSTRSPSGYGGGSTGGLGGSGNVR